MTELDVYSVLCSGDWQSSRVMGGKLDCHGRKSWQPFQGIMNRLEDLANFLNVRPSAITWFCKIGTKLRRQFLISFEPKPVKPHLLLNTFKKCHQGHMKCLLSTLSMRSTESAVYPLTTAKKMQRDTGRYVLLSCVSTYQDIKISKCFWHNWSVWAAEPRKTIWRSPWCSQTIVVLIGYPSFIWYTGRAKKEYGLSLNRPISWPPGCWNLQGSKPPQRRGADTIQNQSRERSASKQNKKTRCFAFYRYEYTSGRTKCLT